MTVVVPGVYPHCQNHGTCYAQATRLTNSERDLKELQMKIEGSDAQILELQTALASRTASVELEKANERLTLAQKTETRYQNNVSRLEEECAALRRIMRTNGYDLSAVDAIVDQIKIKEIE